MFALLFGGGGHIIMQGVDICYGKQGRAACLRNAPCNPREYIDIGKTLTTPRSQQIRDWVCASSKSTRLSAW